MVVVFLTVVSNRVKTMPFSFFLFHSCRFFFGKNKVMIIALGREKEAEYKENLHEIANVSVVEKQTHSPVHISYSLGVHTIMHISFPSEINRTVWIDVYKSSKRGCCEVG